MNHTRFTQPVNKNKEARTDTRKDTRMATRIKGFGKSSEEASEEEKMEPTAESCSISNLINSFHENRFHTISILSVKQLSKPILFFQTLSSIEA